MQLMMLQIAQLIFVTEKVMFQSPTKMLSHPQSPVSGEMQ